MYHSQISLNLNLKRFMQIHAQTAKSEIQLPNLGLNRNKEGNSADIWRKNRFFLSFNHFSPA